MHRTCSLILLTLSFLLALPAGGVPGGNILPSLDVDSLRVPMPNEGYLRFHQDSTQAEERSGWTDVRHPAYFNGVGGPQILTKDNRIGFDRSGNQVTVRNVIVTDGAAAPVTAAPNIASDYNFANQAYSQIGISVISAGNLSATYATVTSPIDDAPANNEALTIRSANRVASPTINNYYIPVFDANVGAVGVAFRPEAFSPNTGTLIENPNGVGGGSARVDTFAHEIGHMLIDDHRFANSGGLNQGHSSQGNDLMASGGGVRNIPAATPKSAQNDAPLEVGFANGNLGGKSLFGENVTTSATFGGLNPVVVSQPTAIYNPETNGNTFVQRTHELNAADRADFQWSEDNKKIEALASPADLHTNLTPDSMRFVIGASLSPDPTGKDFGNWGSLTLGSFTGPSFRVVDVISNIARFTDMDVDATNNWSERESALDYSLEFSADGVNWLNGAPIRVYQQGWTIASDAENYVARWLSPVHAIGVRVTALSAFGGDGNAQIDAIIASPVPEPASLAVWLVVGLTVGGVGWWRRRSA